MSRNLYGFMLGYCQELTGLGTSSLKKLFSSVRDGHPRAAEPLMLLAIAQGREAYLCNLSRSTPYESAYRDFAKRFEESGKDAEEFASSLPATDRFGKAAAAWMSEKQRLERDRSTLKGVAAEMNRILEEKGISRATACNALGLDKGNFYAFLKGDVRRLSRKTALDAYRQLSRA